MNKSLQTGDLLGLARINSIQVRTLGAVIWWWEEGWGDEYGTTRKYEDVFVFVMPEPCGYAQKVQAKKNAPEFELSFIINIRAEFEDHRDWMNNTPLQHELIHVSIYMDYYKDYESALDWMVNKGCLCYDCYLAFDHATSAYRRILEGFMTKNHGQLDLNSYGNDHGELAGGEAMISEGNEAFATAVDEINKNCPSSMSISTPSP